MRRLKDIKIGPRFFGLLGSIFGCIALVYFVSRTGLNSMISSAKAVQHTHEVINAADQITQNMLSMETGLQGFILTGEDEFLIPYSTGRNDLKRNINKTKDLLVDNPKLLYRISRIEKLVNQWIEETGDYYIAQRRKVNAGEFPPAALVNAVKGLDENGETLRRQNGNEAMTEIRSLIQDVISTERDLLAIRHLQSTETAGFVNISILCTVIVVILIGSCFAWFMVNHLKKSIQTAFDFSDKVANGNYYESFTVDQKDEIGLLINNIHRMTDQLRKSAEANQKRQWASKGLSQLNDLMRDENDAIRLANNICKFLADYLDARISSLYLLRQKHLYLTGTYAFSEHQKANRKIAVGEGLVGQTAYDKQLISITDVPEDYARINSSIGDAVPANIVLIPILYNNNTNGVIEIGSFKELSDEKLDFLENVQELIGIGFHNILSQVQLRKLLTETQVQAKELAEKTQKLEASQHKLRMQQEALKDNNDELEEKSETLIAQKKDIEQKNRWLEDAKQVLEAKTKELELASKYKSEFLANMSHELRTPLNSLLLLSKKLSSNKEGNLSDKQIQNAKVIYNSGNDLLQMINEILDLAKIEAGQMSVLCENSAVAEVVSDIDMLIRPLVEKKDLQFIIETEPDVPETINTDSHKLKQILKNLLSNATKFTADGSITLRLYCPEELPALCNPALSGGNALAMDVTDTGVGIPEEKQQSIFEAFQQADGSTSRNYGGTGLGLSISRELSHLLGGELHLKSEVGKGSTFTLLICTNLNEHQSADGAPAKQEAPAQSTHAKADNKKARKTPAAKRTSPAEKPMLLIIEADPDFSARLKNRITQMGYEHMCVSSGQEAIDAAANHRITGIILDTGPSAIEGLNTLDRLKINRHTAHIPIYVMSENAKSFLFDSSDFIGYLQRPISDENMDLAIQALVPDEQPTAPPTSAPPPEEPSRPATKEPPPEPAPPPRPEKENPAQAQESTPTQNVSEEDKELLAGKTILVVDDDIRNLYALGEELADLDMTIVKATNGKLALDLLHKHPETDIVLMDVMMPVLNGYEAIKAIRKDPAIKDVPIIAITAKAMQEDRQICLDAGADDYLTKPINLEKLLTVMSTWTKKQRTT